MNHWIIEFLTNVDQHKWWCEVREKNWNISLLICTSLSVSFRNESDFNNDGHLRCWGKKGYINLRNHTWMLGYTLTKGWAIQLQRDGLRLRTIMVNVFINLKRENTNNLNLGRRVFFWIVNKIGKVCSIYIISVKIPKNMCSNWVSIDCMV